jgi:hypothetical protein
MRNFIICTHPQISLGKSNQGECGGRGMGEKSVQGFGGKARSKEIARKTKAQVGRWDQNGS